MSATLKPIEDQVMVITGATSGIGLTTARMAAQRGARVVLAARSEEDLKTLANEINDAGGDAVYIAADVSDRADVRQIAAVAADTYGGFDTWVNVAGAFIYGKLEETPIEDMREQFDTNVWGLLYGSLEAASHLKKRGGAIINISSITSDQAMPLLGSYSASKHAIEGFTDALRMELDEEGAPVSVTLIKPASIDTSYPAHAKNHMETEAELPPPVYAPETVARTILDAAETPQREVIVGGGGKGMIALGRYAPRVMDKIMETLYVPLQKGDRPPRPLEENIIDGPAGGLQERGDEEGYVSETSLYTEVDKRGLLTKIATVGLGAAALALYSRFISKRRGDARALREQETGRFRDIPIEDSDSGQGLSVTIRNIFMR